MPSAMPSVMPTLESPITPFVVRVALVFLLVGVLVTLLLTSAFVILNMGLLYKRKTDKAAGSPTPGELGILQHLQFPEKGKGRKKSA